VRDPERLTEVGIGSVEIDGIEPEGPSVYLTEPSRCRKRAHNFN
jgi:hypothetical protein